LNDPQVARLLQERFVCIAVDNVQNKNMTAAEWQWLKSRGGDACTQGMSVFTAGGNVLARGGGYEAEPVARMLQKALQEFEPDAAVAIDDDKSGSDMTRRPPEGAAVLFATWKVLGGYDQTEPSATTGDGHYDAYFRRAVGLDRLWVRADEQQALSRGDFPATLRQRIARYHLSYALAGKIDDFDVTLKGGDIEGRFRSDTGDTGLLLGRVECRERKLARFDLVVKGLGQRVEDCGFAASLTVVPKGKKVPVGLLFTLAAPEDQLALVPPHHAADERYSR
jgi:hypothetical protein